MVQGFLLLFHSCSLLILRYNYSCYFTDKQTKASMRLTGFPS